jgi:glycerol-3-phosphate dehydrogenase
MKRDFNLLSGGVFDLIVIGGGIIGTGIARDAALRGFHTLLVEKEDFAYGTTSRSTRLIHGGLRYLRTFQLGLVKQDLKEREVLLHIAPHLVHQLRFFIPILRSEPLYRFTLPFGLYLYDILSAGKSLPRWKRLSLKDTLKLEPGLAGTDGLIGAYVYYDCQVQYVERLCLENALSAAENKACILNHTAAVDVIREDGKVTGIQMQDMLTGKQYTAKGRVVLNAGGHWADKVLEKFKINSTARLRRTKGIHLLTRKVSDNALVLFSKSDGRLFFVIPWGNYSLIGTTDTDYSGDLDQLYATAADVEYLVTETKHYFPGFKKEDIYYTTAGLRPLVAAGDKASSDTSRAHKLVDHELKSGLPGFITVLGGKITAYRAIAEEAVDLVGKKLGKNIKCTTASTKLSGAETASTRAIKQYAEENILSSETVSYLSSLYGARLTTVLKYIGSDKRMIQPIGDTYPDILAQVKYAIEEEEAVTLSDFIMRRSTAGLAPTQGANTIEIVSREMGRLLGWNEAERQNQISNHQAFVDLSHRFDRNGL